MALISPQLQKQNIPSVNYSSKIKLSSKDVGLDFLLAKDTGRFYEVHFALQINPKGHEIDPSVPLTPRNIDMSSLHKAIMNNIRPYDQRYMVISDFDTNKVKFRFNHEKWMKKATSGLTPKTKYSKFDREFKLKVAPPPMILTTHVRKPFEDFIVRKFLDWLESSHKEAKYFKYLFPNSIRSRIRTKARNMFDWEYDTQWNTVIARLKNIYILALLYATGEITKRLTSRNLQKSQKELFATKVKKNMDKFDRKKWEKFIRRKFV